MSTNPNKKPKQRPQNKQNTTYKPTIITIAVLTVMLVIIVVFIILLAVLIPNNSSPSSSSSSSSASSLIPISSSHPVTSLLAAYQRSDYFANNKAQILISVELPLSIGSNINNLTTGGPFPQIFSTGLSSTYKKPSASNGEIVISSPVGFLGTLGNMGKDNNVWLSGTSIGLNPLSCELYGNGVINGGLLYLVGFEYNNKLTNNDLYLVYANSVQFESFVNHSTNLSIDFPIIDNPVIFYQNGGAAHNSLILSSPSFITKSSLTFTVENTIASNTTINYIVCKEKKSGYADVKESPILYAENINFDINQNGSGTKTYKLPIDLIPTYKLKPIWLCSNMSFGNQPSLIISNIVQSGNSLSINYFNSRVGPATLSVIAIQKTNHLITTDPKKINLL